MRKGLTKEKIIDSAIQLLEGSGLKDFSVYRLAEKLGVSVSSLYKHVTNVDEINFEIALKTVEELILLQESAMEGKTRQEAVWAMASAFREFAFSHPETFKMITILPGSYPASSRNFRRHLMEPIKKAVGLYDISEDQRMHWLRILRSTMHGFVTYEMSAADHEPELVNTQESYRIAITNIIFALESLEKAHLSRAKVLLED